MSKATRKMSDMLSALPNNHAVKLFPVWVDLLTELSNNNNEQVLWLEGIILEVKALQFDLDCTRNERDEALTQLEE